MEEKNQRKKIKEKNGKKKSFVSLREKVPFGEFLPSFCLCFFLWFPVGEKKKTPLRGRKKNEGAFSQRETKH
jgi:hypothetical protein